jgi:cytochrome c-type biogenesis protein CcmH
VTSTTLLYALVLILAGGVTVYVVRPLLRRQALEARDDAPRTAATARDVLRERRRELDASLAHLPAGAPERNQAMAEFAAQVQGELDGGAMSVSDPQTIPQQRAFAGESKRRPLMAAGVLALMLVAPSLTLYLLTGMPEAVSPEFRSASEPQNLEDLIDALKERLQKHPTDAQGWQLLGRTELSRGQPSAAIEAFERALPLAPKDAQLKADLADAIAQQQGNRLDGRPIALLREALEHDPRHPKALALNGAFEVSQGNTAAAIGYWDTLLTVLPPDSPQAAQISGYVADLKAGKRPGSEPSTAPSAPAQPPAAVASPAAASARAAEAVSGTVVLDPTLVGKLDPTATLFVVARSLDDQGQPSGPPLAVLRARAADLPLRFNLDDSRSMSPTAKLSGLAPSARVSVVARVSATGEATVRPGDLQGSSAPVNVGATDLTVRIDKVAP